MSQGSKHNLSGFQSDILLKSHSTFRIGGQAKYFLTANTNEKLIEAISLARESALPFFVLGGGSNVLMSDREFRGLVIKVATSKLSVGGKKEKNRVFAQAGVSTVKLTSFAAEHGLSGLEWLRGIPGTIGGAIRGNAAAFGSSVADAIESVEAYNVKKQKRETFKNRDCGFGNKISVFKNNPNLVILECVLNLKKGKKNSIERKMKEYADYRKKTQPLNFPSIGCIFRNYGSENKNVFSAKTIEKFPELGIFIEKGFVPAGYLIDRCGLKGKKIGSAKVSEKHANFIINIRDAKAKDVRRLIKLIKDKIKKQFGIVLKEEIEYFNFS